VQWTATDAAELGLNTFVIWDLTRAVDDAHDDDVRESFRASDIRIIDSKILTAAIAV
jgi:nicotinamidase/pyrazinamidase